VSRLERTGRPRGRWMARLAAAEFLRGSPGASTAVHLSARAAWNRTASKAAAWSRAAWSGAVWTRAAWNGTAWNGSAWNEDMWG
jgi:hypothetical protein